MLVDVEHRHLEHQAHPGSTVGTGPGYPAPGAGWMDATLQPSAVTSGTLCFAVTKPVSSDIWITVDDLNRPTRRSSLSRPDHSASPPPASG